MSPNIPTVTDFLRIYTWKLRFLPTLDSSRPQVKKKVEGEIIPGNSSFKNMSILQMSHKNSLWVKEDTESLKKLTEATVHN